MTRPMQVLKVGGSIKPPDQVNMRSRNRNVRLKKMQRYNYCSINVNIVCREKCRFGIVCKINTFTPLKETLFVITLKFGIGNEPVVQEEKTSKYLVKWTNSSKKNI
jgi:hypothetical protein